MGKGIVYPMNLMQLLEFLNSDLAEWERQRRLRKMMSPDDEYMDGKSNAQGGVAVRTPYQRNFNDLSPKQDPYTMLERIPFTLDQFPLARPRQRPLTGPKTKYDLEV